MNISSYNSVNRIRYGLKENNAREKSKEFFPQKNNVSFTGINPVRVVEIVNADKIVSRLDDIFGEKYFSELLTKAGLKIEKGDNSEVLKYVNPTVAHDLKRTGISLVNVFITGFRKAYKLFANEDIKGKNKISAAMLRISEDVERNKNFDKVTEIVEAIADGRKNLCDLNDSQKTNEIADGILGKVLPNVKKINKPYQTRDERSLNRLATSFVSAVFAANDYHNISMLKKNNTEEAKASAKDRFQQDMIRAGISAGLSYFTLGALDRYTKKSLLLNASVIALSALISEITTRIIKHKSLIPLTPAKAKEIANKRKGVNSTAQYKPQTVYKQDKPAVYVRKSNLSNDKEIFKNFTNANGEFDSINELNKQSVRDLNKASIQANAGKNNKKGNKLLKIALGAVILSSIVYLAKSLKSGKMSTSLNTLKYSKAKGSSSKLKTLGEKIKNSEKKTAQLEKKLSKIKDGVFKVIPKGIIDKKQKFMLDKADSKELISKLNKIKETSKGAEIKEVIDAYIKKIDALVPDEKTVKVTPTGSKEIIFNRDTILLKGIKEAVSKVFGTIYQICSMPGHLIEFGLEKAAELNEEEYIEWANKHKLFDKKPPKLDEEVIELAKLCLNKGKSPIVLALNEKIDDIIDSYRAPKIIKNIAEKFKSVQKDDSKIAETIMGRIRKLGVTQETGQLAHYSRTFVTLISSFFFVNDYYNESLINSEGNDIEAAKVKRNEKIGHKIINYITNGLFMNIFNSVFKTPLNSSLTKATLVAAATEVTNESTIRAFTCEPRMALNSKEEIIEYEQKKLNRKGIMGAWSRFFRKITGKKTLTQKTAS